MYLPEWYPWLGDPNVIVPYMPCGCVWNGKDIVTWSENCSAPDNHVWDSSLNQIIEKKNV